MKSSYISGYGLKIFLTKSVCSFVLLGKTISKVVKRRLDSLFLNLEEESNAVESENQRMPGPSLTSSSSSHRSRTVSSHLSVTAPSSPAPGSTAKHSVRLVVFASTCIKFSRTEVWCSLQLLSNSLIFDAHDFLLATCTLVHSLHPCRESSALLTGLIAVLPRYFCRLYRQRNTVFGTQSSNSSPVLMLNGLGKFLKT